MSSVANMLTSLILAAISAGPVVAGVGDNHVSKTAAAPSDICFSNPIIAAQTSWQCSSEMAANSTGYAHDTNANPDEEESSGGWTGPHACEGEYCVYANPTFAAGRGICVISDGDSANALANLPVFAELTVAPGAGEVLRSQNINVQSAGVEVRDIPGKGRGFVAARTLHRGEQLLAYTPALVLHRSMVDDLGRAQQLALLRDAVGRLPAATRAAFWRQLGPTHEPGDDDVLEIVMTNSFNLPLSLPGAHTFVGNFPEVSMFNHDCRPGAAYHLDAGLVHRTYVAAAAGLRAGDEVSISYLDGFRARDVRRARARANWGFECGCAQCSLPPALANASDHRLWRIYEVEGALRVEPGTTTAKKPAGGSKYGGAAAYEREELDRVELLLSLYEQERLLESHGAAAYRVAALNYSAFRRRALAVKYALLALEAGAVEEGAGSAGVAEMVALVTDPEKHWSWGRKKN